MVMFLPVFLAKEDERRRSVQAAKTLWNFLCPREFQYGSILIGTQYRIEDVDGEICRPEHPSRTPQFAR